MADTPDLNELMKKAQEMQTKMQDLQKQITDMEVIGQAGGGLVRITFNGQHYAKRVEIDESTLSDKAMLEDLIAAAINNGSEKIERRAKDKMSALAQDFQLPDNMDLPTSQ